MMKTLYDYITEKANFLVKKHIEKPKYIKRNELKIGECYLLIGKYGKENYEGTYDEQYTTLCKILSISDDEIWFEWTYNFKNREVYTPQRTTLLDHLYLPINTEQQKIADAINNFIDNDKQLQNDISNHDVNKLYVSDKLKVTKK